MKLAELTKCTGCKIVFRHKQIGTGTILYKIELKSFRYEYEFIIVTQNFLLKVVSGSESKCFESVTLKCENAAASVPDVRRGLSPRLPVPGRLVPAGAAGRTPLHTPPNQN